MKRFWCCRDLEGAANEEVFLFVGEEPPIMDDDGVGFVESLPDIANGEMTEIRIKYTAEKCE